MNKKRAFLIVSTGNCGNRLIAGLFKESGCWGDVVGHNDGWKSRLDKGIWPKNDVCNIFWRTHKNKDEKKITGEVGQTSIYRMVDQCLERGYEPTIITIFRDIPTTSYGAVKRGYREDPVKDHTPLSSTEQVRYHETEIQKSYLRYHGQTLNVLTEMQDRGHQVFVVDMAGLQNNPILYIRMFATEIDFPLNDKVKVKKDADAKHYARFNNKEELAVYRNEENKTDGT